jgi:hypothetical protein
MLHPRISVGLALLVAAMAPVTAAAAVYDLSAAGSQMLWVNSDFGSRALVADYWSQPTGTGVFDPFLTLDANGQTSTGSNYVEQAYNAQGFNNLYLDGLRPKWNTTLRVGDLASVKVGNAYYFAFILDANEPGGAKSVISIDNIRIYTSANDNTATVGNDIAKLDQLGDLRWAMNDPTRTGNIFNIDNWIKLNASQENILSHSNGGSGQSDMILYVPQAAFLGAKADDYLWLYNLNGVHYSVNVNLGATAGYEEWRAVTGTQVQLKVPDAASTLGLLTSAMAVLGLFARRFRRALN